MKIFGLLGKNIDYSFSRGYFKSKFENNNLDCSYINFDIESIEEFKKLKENSQKLAGLNVTIPYKELVIPYLDSLEKEAKEIGAVNTIKIENNQLIGYNTDHYGFRESLIPLLEPHHKSALILGTGGASKAVAYALKELGIQFEYVSRTKTAQVKYSYSTLPAVAMDTYKIIVNCTPLGTFPEIEKCPNIPYEKLSKKHLLFDLIYNPSETQFLKNGKAKQSKTINGLEMLKIQAEKSWEIWNSNK